MKKIQDGAGFFFIFAVVVLTAISVFGVWDVFAKDVISKSFQTLGLLAGVAVAVVFAARFLGGKSHEVDPNLPVVPNPAFHVIRKITLGVFIFAVAVLAFIGILSIWDMVDRTVLSRAISSIGIIAFSSFLVVFTCIDREDSDLLKRMNVSSGFAWSVIITILVLMWLFGGFW